MLDILEPHGFSVTIFLLALVGTGAVILFENIQLAYKRRQVHKELRIFQEYRDILEDKAGQLERLRDELDTIGTQLGSVTEENFVMGRRKEKRGNKSFEFIHEIGRPERDRTAFHFRLRRKSTRAVEAGETISHASIWNHSNAALVWAVDEENAVRVLNAVFAAGTGVEIADSPLRAAVGDGA